MEQKTVPLNPESVRAPLVDVSNRVNNCPSPNLVQGEESMGGLQYLSSPQPMSIVTSPPEQKRYVDNNCLSPTANPKTSSKRNSTLSANSVISNQGKRKTHVGPWQLGRNLGEGTTGRVRLAKHKYTGQTAAIKIVSKTSAAMTQSNSIAEMDRNRGLHGKSGTRHIPSGIEREVVIMKLIEHPNVVRLYDVWENRGEIYLVLEYVEGGELFNYITENGPLQEFEAVKLFRQILAGLGYCHRFGICHRDLKPENILLDSQGNVKLADFGMAALQREGYWLKTSCGSPHYAAPEIVKGDEYRGNKADLWSCGIILFALLTSYLPFDGQDLSSTLKLVKTAKVEIPSNVSYEAADLIHKILQKKPEKRIDMADVWKHPLLRRYECLDPVMHNPYIGPAPSWSVKECGPRISRHELESESDILRNLQTLWHDVEREVLIERLLDPEPTLERMFYNALVRFRDEHLENWPGQSLEYSASDYHHISKDSNGTFSRRDNDRSKGSRRRGQVPMSKVAQLRSNAIQEPKSCATVGSYDPFRSPCHVVPEKEGHTYVTIHRDVPDHGGRKEESDSIAEGSVISEEEFRDQTPCPPSSPFAIVQNKKKPSSLKSFHSRTSHTGNRRQLNGLSAPRSASYKRNVCFRHVRNRSQGSTTAMKPKGAPINVPDKDMSENSLMSIDPGPFADRESSPLLPAQPAVVRRPGVALRTCAPQKKVRESDFIWKDDARQVSHELSQICEEAFNRASLSTGCTTTSTCMSAETPATSVSMASPEASHSRIATSNSKAPVTPSRCGESPRSYTAAELTETRRKLIAHSTQDGTEDVPGYLVAVIKHLDRLIEQDKARQRERVYTPEPEAQPSELSQDAGCLPKISEELHNRQSNSATQYKPYRPGLTTSTGTNTGRPSRNGIGTIRMVPQSSVPSIETIQPLTIRKKSEGPSPNIHHEPFADGSNEENLAPCRYSSMNSFHSRRPCELDPIAEIPPKSEKRNAARYPDNKKWSWLPIKHQPPTETVCKNLRPLHPVDRTVTVHEVNPSADSLTNQPETPAGKSKGGFFKKFMKGKASNPKYPTTGQYHLINTIRTSSNRPVPDSQATETTPILSHPTEPPRLINADKPLPQRPGTSRKPVNWFARMFQFTPATKALALNTSKMKGRKEVHRILREWKPYGITVHYDKADGIIYGKVSRSNIRRIRPVAFSAEFYTVLEDGRRGNLSLVRFKQERGAVSSFNKVIDTLEKFMKRRGLLVEDPVRAQQMMKVLDKYQDPQGK
ncbi:unnamed protein product [Aspergillus oryzae RIB40]|uniref:non-specific serine/threonine protein kinase n=1 Tax=Aspergillus oryzae (strain ATCC 42149 / RIB 40) TaxID=510516 RepID=Q2U6S5_ASPOR|nr:unnamed protein product [Aspergillus oryzae RIB40]BAE62740.1 unnamed protein product [Aspergillus oryzae RIB40]